MAKKYSQSDYLKGDPKFNLLRAQRRLIIKALVHSEWKMKIAFKLNYPNENIGIEAYNHLLLRHHISVLNKNFKKYSEIP